MPHFRFVEPKPALYQLRWVVSCFATLFLAGCQLDSTFRQDEVPLILDPPSNQEAENLERLFAAEPPAADYGELFVQYHGGVRPESDISTTWANDDIE